MRAAFCSRDNTERQYSAKLCTVEILREIAKIKPIYRPQQNEYFDTSDRLLYKTTLMNNRKVTRFTLTEFQIILDAEPFYSTAMSKIYGHLAFYNVLL